MRSKDHFEDITSLGATPVLLSLEDASAEALAEKFAGARAVIFSAGAGGKGGAERTNAVDYLGAVKTFDAIEKVEGEKPKLFMVSALDTRDMSKPPPTHYVSLPSSMILAITDYGTRPRRTSSSPRRATTPSELITRQN